VARLLVHNKSGTWKLKHTQLTPNFRLLGCGKPVQPPYRSHRRTVFAGYAVDGLPAANCGRRYPRDGFARKEASDVQISKTTSKLVINVCHGRNRPELHDRICGYRKTTLVFRVRKSEQKRPFPLGSARCISRP
jgi:hypothetical protein